jgi:hypothetical protein
MTPYTAYRLALVRECREDGPVYGLLTLGLDLACRVLKAFW